MGGIWGVWMGRIRAKEHGDRDELREGSAGVANQFLLGLIALQVDCKGRTR